MIMSNINRNTMQVIIPLEKIFSWFSEFKNREFGGRLDIEWGNKHKARNHQAFEKLALNHLVWTIISGFRGEKKNKNFIDKYRKLDHSIVRIAQEGIDA